MTPNTCDGGEDPTWARRGQHPRARVVAAWAALLQIATWGCREQTATSHDSAGAAGAPSRRSASSATPPSPGAQSPGEPSVRSQMLSHYADTVAMRRALVAGKLADFQAAAAAVARDPWGPTETRAWSQRARDAAAAAQHAPSVVEAALALGALGEVCASCHVASEAPLVPVAPDEPLEASNPRMLAHAVASERLWAGLTLPSDDSWASGVQLLLQDPALADPSAEVAAASRLLLDLARRAEHAEPDERGRIFADVLVTCSGCHERLGVVLDQGTVVR